MARRKKTKRDMTFKDVFKFPLEALEGLSSKVFTADHAMAFDFPSNFMRRIYPDLIVTGEETRFKILSCINGVSPSPKTELILTYDPDSTIIFIEIEGKQREFIIVRGWGNLTGCGGHNLSEKVAVRLQTEFAEYIIKKLTE